MKNKFIGSLAFLMIIVFAFGLVVVIDQKNDKITQLEAVIEEKLQIDRPEITEGNWTFFQYQYGCTNVYYSTQHYYEGNKLFIRDRESGYVFPIVFDNNVTSVPGWIEDEELLFKYGVYMFTDDEYYGLEKE